MNTEDLHIGSLQGKKLFFASDFHLGAPTEETSKEREARIVRWLEEIRPEAHSIFLMGDIFDFWFEYKHAIPRGFVRLQGKIAEFTDAGIPVYFFTGNHDMWMFDYFKKELNVTIFRDLVRLKTGNKRLLLGHGDGLGPGDYSYKILKRIFRNRVCQWLFARIHPNAGIGLAKFWSQHSRISNDQKQEDQFRGDDEYLLQYCREMEKTEHFDYYIFGHRHLPLDVGINADSRYVNLGEWVSQCTYAVFNGETTQLITYEG